MHPGTVFAWLSALDKSSLSIERVNNIPAYNVDIDVTFHLERVPLLDMETLTFYKKYAYLTSFRWKQMVAIFRNNHLPYEIIHDVLPRSLYQQQHHLVHFGCTRIDCESHIYLYCKEWVEGQCKVVRAQESQGKLG